MPVTWNAEAEAKLLACLFRICDIKVSGDQLKLLAESVGPECTPKAVTHRLAKFRTQATAFNGGIKGKKDAEDGAAGGTKSKKAAGDAGAAGTPSKKRHRRPSKKDVASNDETDADDDELESAKTKKAKLIKAEDSCDAVEENQEEGC